jgi:SAM-dependent methyltransferase
VVEYYSGLPRHIFDCKDCGCRFTRHDEWVHDELHAQAASYYGAYRELARRSKQLFDSQDSKGLKRELSTLSKYKFVIDQVESTAGPQRMLEVGCSRGYLASYFILTGHRLVAADISPVAIAAAREAFGNCFVLAGSPTIKDSAPYDVIYHVGTIGCLGDPIGFTWQMLGMLRPGGMLLFNAPNRDGLWLRQQLWVDSAPPPDLVTLFAPGFWKTEFSEAAEVEETVEMCPTDQGVTIGVRKLVGRRWRPPVPEALDSRRWPPAPADGLAERLMLLMKGGARRTGRITGLSRFVPRQPYEFGLMVKMTKK